MGLPTPMKFPRDWADNFELPMRDTELCIFPILLSTELGRSAGRLSPNINAHSSRRRRSSIVFGNFTLNVVSIVDINHQCSTFWSRRKAKKKKGKTKKQDRGGEKKEEV